MLRLFAPVALLPKGWAFDVLLEIAADGTFSSVTARSSSEGAAVLAGTVLPGMPNVHSHAFQRVLAGRTERRLPLATNEADSFWTWREAMYELVECLNPDQFEAISAWAYIEMLKAGYTAVAEFHYLHHDLNGKPYDRRTELSERVLAAAKTAGIGLTLLPVLYCYGDFAAHPPKPQQARFLLSLEGYVALWEELCAIIGDNPHVRLGTAAHSLRAVGVRELAALVEGIEAHDRRAPIHIHISEQRPEVDACRVTYGKSPIEYLYNAVKIDDRWCLVHGTHMTSEELLHVVEAGAMVGLCPTTEANLGDGIFPATEFARKGGRFGVGSDSNVSIDVAEELRWLEYTQRLRDRRRVLLASKTVTSVGDYLYRSAVLGGKQASGREIGALVAGARADLVVLDGCMTLDAYIFSAGRSAVRDVMVGGAWVVQERRHPGEEEALRAYQRAVDTLTG